MAPHFQLINVEHKGGRYVIAVRDSVTGEVVKVCQRGTRWLHWSGDLRVENKALQRVAREALREATA